jgi:hypothetical protein
VDGAGAVIAAAVEDALGASRAIDALPLAPERVRAVGAESAARGDSRYARTGT